MFVVDSAIKPYPNKGILEDVLSRDGGYSDEAFTPYMGMRKILREQLQGDAAIFDLKEILANVREFDPSKARANDDGVNREYSASEITDYYVRLEDISEKFIQKYVREVIIGFKINNCGRRNIESQMKTYDALYDEEDETYVDSSDLEVEEIEYSAKDIVEAKSKLPYLLKQLHMGSIEKEGSLMSFIIAGEQLKKKNLELLPRYVLSMGVYEMYKSGSLGPLFPPETANTRPKFRRCMAWLRGEEDDVYYKAYKELLRVSDVLGIDISEEDPTVFDKELIQDLVCTYIASNEEYIETYGYIDKKILDALGTKTLFSIARELREDESDIVSDTTAWQCIERLVINTESLWDMTETEDEWARSREKVMQVLMYNYGWSQEEAKKNMRRYRVFKGFVRDSKGAYIILRVLNSGTREFALLMANGRLIKYSADCGGFIEYIDAYDYIRAGGGAKFEWRCVSL